MSRIADVLNDAHHDDDLLTAVRSPVTALVGVGEDAGKALNSIGITTVLELAGSNLFAIAEQLTHAGEADAVEVARLGVVCADALTEKYHDVSAESVPSLPLSALKSMDSGKGDYLSRCLHVRSIRELGLWPPYLLARQLLREVTGGELSELERTPDLVPATGRYPSERVQYDVLVFDQDIRPREGSGPAGKELPLEAMVAADVLAAAERSTLALRPALGALLTFTQSWYTLGLTLGHLLHSLALAPGESTRIAVLDWNRRLRAAATELGAEAEALVSDLVHNRSLNEVTQAVARELQTGASGSDVSTVGANAGVGAGYGSGTGGAGSGSYGSFNFLGAVGDALGIGGAAGIGGGESHASSWSSSAGERDLSAEMTQHIVDRTHQASTSTRNRWASVVREVSQEEHESISTRAVTNYNHMHALTMEYYEVIQLYRVVVELTKVGRCLFIPMRLLDFNDDKAITRFRLVLGRAALIPAVRALTEGEPDSLMIKYPSSRTPIQPPRDQNEGLWTATGRILPTAGKSYSVSSFELYDKGKAIGESPFDSLIIELQDGTQKECTLRVDPIVDARHTWIDVVDAFPGQTLELSSIRRLSIRKAADKVSYVGSHANVVIYLHRDKPGPGFLPALEGPELQVEAGPSPTVAWEITSFVTACAGVRDHLNANRLYYSQAIWNSLDVATYLALLSGYTYNGQRLVQIVDPKPIAVAGGYLIFLLHASDAKWVDFIKRKILCGKVFDSSGSADSGANGRPKQMHRESILCNRVAEPGKILQGEPDEKTINDTILELGIRRETVVPLPTGGVFAEAVLGRSNSAEKLDVTRFWNWADSPIPIAAPEIAPIAAGQHKVSEAEGIQPQGVGQPVLNIVNPAPLPDPQGLTAILAALQNGAMFRDMSGQAATIGLAQAALSDAVEAAQAAAATASGNAQAAMAQAGKNLATAAETFGAVFGKGAGGAGSPTASSPAAAPPTISNLGAKYNAAEQLDHEQGKSGGAVSPSQQPAGAGTQTNGSSTGSEVAASRRDQVLGTCPVTAPSQPKTGGTGSGARSRAVVMMVHWPGLNDVVEGLYEVNIEQAELGKKDSFSFELSLGSGVPSGSVKLPSGLWKVFARGQIRAMPAQLSPPTFVPVHVPIIGDMLVKVGEPYVVPPTVFSFADVYTVGPADAYLKMDCQPVFAEEKVESEIHLQGEVQASTEFKPQIEAGVEAALDALVADAKGSGKVVLNFGVQVAGSLQAGETLKTTITYRRVTGFRLTRITP